MSAPAPTQKKVSDWGRECKRILKFLKEQPDAGNCVEPIAWLPRITPKRLACFGIVGPFLQPVDWKAWGLDDYPTIVKQPMDLSKVEVGKGETVPQEGRIVARKGVANRFGLRALAEKAGGQRIHKHRGLQQGC